MGLRAAKDQDSRPRGSPETQQLRFIRSRGDNRYGIVMRMPLNRHNLHMNPVTLTTLRLPVVTPRLHWRRWHTIAWRAR